MRVRVLAFARLRELIGAGSQTCELADGATAQAVWSQVTARHPGAEDLAESVRIARNGRIVSLGEQLADGDEIALLPPVGGG